jgi:hypothetical protein
MGVETAAGSGCMREGEASIGWELVHEVVSCEKTKGACIVEGPCESQSRHLGVLCQKGVQANAAKVLGSKDYFGGEGATKGHAGSGDSGEE